MKYSISLIDFLNLDKDLLLSKESDLAFYTGINTEKITVNTSFNCIYDSKNSNHFILGDFKIKEIEVLQTPVNETIVGYHATIYLSSSVKIEYIKKVLEFDENENIKNVCVLSDWTATQALKMLKQPLASASL